MRKPYPTEFIIGAAVIQFMVYATLIAVTVTFWLSPPGPITTVSDANGQQIDLDWADYPADPSVDPDRFTASTTHQRWSEAVWRPTLTGPSSRQPSALS